MKKRLFKVILVEVSFKDHVHTQWILPKELYLLTTWFNDGAKRITVERHFMTKAEKQIHFGF